jgi:hypothetical protein
MPQSAVPRHAGSLTGIVAGMVAQFGQLDSESTRCTYEEFGARFFRAAVTPERILGAVDGIAGEPIDFGPMGVGPGRIAQVTAKGQIGQATATELPGIPISYELVVPVELDFTIDLQVEKERFHAFVEVPLIVTAHATTDLQIVVDVTPPNPDQLKLDLAADGLRAGLLGRIANVNGELRRFVAKYVGRELEKPHIVATRNIDVGVSIDVAWAGMAPGRGMRDATTD